MPESTPDALQLAGVVSWDPRQSESCKSCGARMQWVRTSKGRRMPVDPDPVGGGNVTVSVIAGVAHAEVHADGSTVPAGTAAYVSHFSTCPEASKHRRRA